MVNSFSHTQHFSLTPVYLAFKYNSLTNSSIKSSEFPNRSAQSFASNILGINVVPKVSNLTTHSTTVGAFRKMLECVCESRGVLNLSSFTIWVLRWMASLFWNKGWWNINYNVFSLRGTTRHLQKNRHIAENQEKNPHDTNINLIRFKLVNEISAHWNIERDSTQMW